jgi:hypothetical protein
MNSIRKYFRKKRIIREWKDRMKHHESGNSPYAVDHDLRVWKVEVYKRGIGRLNGEKQGKYLFENLLQEVRDTYNEKFIPSEEKEYRDYLNKYICDNVVPVIKSVFENDPDWREIEKNSVIEILTEHSQNPYLSMEQYIEKVKDFMVGDYMTWKQWKRQKSLDKLLKK